MSELLRIVEVGPRDGLQNEAVPIPTGDKLSFIRRLLAAGLQEIEVSSFVSPKWVPQLGDVEDLWPQLPTGGAFSALVPNIRGLERALELDVSRLAMFTAASSAFTQKNINMTVDESLTVFRQMIEAARQKDSGIFVRGYVSTVFQCPYAGKISADAVVPVVDSLIEMGCNEVSLGDTVGAGVPVEVRALAMALRHVPKDRVVWHFHDTRGTAIANVATAVELGFRSFDASAGGLGGCPYAPGAGGNLATEDLVYFAERSGLRTGVNLELLAQASIPVLERLARRPFAKAQQAVLST